MYQVDISATVRENTGKGAMRRLRQEGLTPGVVYGGGREAQAIQLDSKSLMTQLLEFYKVNTIVTLKVDGFDDKSVVVGEVQTHPVRETLVHVDFCDINLEEESEFTVPVIFEGTPKGVDIGGFQTNVTNEVVLKAKPLDIPNEIVVDVTGVDVDGEIVVSDLTFAAGVTVVTPAADVLVTVTKPTV